MVKKKYINEKIYHIHGSEDLILLRLICGFKMISIKMLSDFFFFRNRQTDPKMHMKI